MRSVVRSLGISTIFVHRYASILSAYGLFLAEVPEACVALPDACVALPDACATRRMCCARLAPLFYTKALAKALAKPLAKPLAKWFSTS
jgi:hypothetical protein